MTEYEECMVNGLKDLTDKLDSIAKSLSFMIESTSSAGVQNLEIRQRELDIREKEFELKARELCNNTENEQNP